MYVTVKDLEIGLTAKGLDRAARLAHKQALVQCVLRPTEPRSWRQVPASHKRCWRAIARAAIYAAAKGEAP